ncbi:hypothetical protein JOC54_001128 [Alkalihalobacillus xiaoxiensis]|uniref:DUF8052 domain-containing protein n=1 Tax=Shouchella xiaoxiensis TaxID=766895 RepID=A0ABS2SUH4_9BACI|nr:hypothetical protein [Shouchella xiaoxiensis]MBM7837897.1 hypothetical protein [Shouchella xiaoxiensis]
MRAEQYVNQLQNVLKHQFDVYGNDQIGSLPLHFSAHYTRRDDRYMMTKDIKVWSVENNQFFFFYEAKEASVQEFVRFKEELDLYITRHRATKSSHISSIYIGLFFLEGTPDSDLIKKAKRTRKVSFINWGRYGWIERYIAVLPLETMDIHMNRKGLSFIKPFIESLNKTKEV